MLSNIDSYGRQNPVNLCEFMTLDGVHIEDITDIYVLGHSFGDPDYDYFEFLANATKLGADFNKLSALWQARNLGRENMNEDDLLEWIQMNIVYAASIVKRSLRKRIFHSRRRR